MTDDSYVVERSTTIEAPAADIYAKIVNFRDWTSWSPWEGLDPDLRRTYSGADAGVGAVYAWSGNRKAGRGRMEIIEATEPQQVRIELLFEKPFKARNIALFTIRPEGTGSHVTWTITGKKTFMTKAMGLVTSMDKLIGGDFERGLAQLKATTETPASPE